jgi:hypothetical protein
MKTARFFMAAAALMASAVFSCKAGEYYYSPNAPTVIYTNVTFSSNFTASSTFTNTQGSGMSIGHTFNVFYTAAGTNSSNVILEKTIDGANWLTVTNVTWGVSTNMEIQTVGKYAQYRYRVTALSTNGSMTALYMSE